LVGSLILRYILFVLIVDLSGIIREPLKYLFTAAAFGFLSLAGWAHFNDASLPIVAAISSNIGSLLNTLIYWGLFFTIAWPLFKDILTFLGVNLGDFGWRAIVREIREWRTFTAKIREVREN
jgi:hypothetical protein